MECSLIPYPSLWQGSAESEEIGLRLIVVPNGGSSLAQRKNARRTMSHHLAKSGHLKTGDVVLTFRPEMADSMAYPHIQMGVTHAGLVYTKEDGHAGIVAMNIDSPLDSMYLGQLDSAHYAGDGARDAGCDALHVVRPRGMTEVRRARMSEWINTVTRNKGRFNGQRSQVKFQSDYMNPSYNATDGTTRQTVTTLGKIVLEQDKRSKLPMYCSEFAWHMLALSHCSQEEIRAAGPEGAACMKEPFAPMPMTAVTAEEVGMADGPLYNLLQLSQRNRKSELAEIFCSDAPCDGGARLSSGHRAVATMVSDLMAGLEQIFAARVGGATVEQTAPGARQLNSNLLPNYSPTAFLAQSMETGLRACDYVATLIFTNDADYENARELAISQDASCGGKGADNLPSTPICYKRGEPVMRAQVILRDQGQRIVPDGAWGPNTQRALETVQDNNLLERTGCLNDAALLGLDGLAAGEGSSSSASEMTPDTPSSGCSEACIRDISILKSAQRKLGTTADGIFGNGSNRLMNERRETAGLAPKRCLTQCSVDLL